MTAWQSLKSNRREKNLNIMVPEELFFNIRQLRKAGQKHGQRLAVRDTVIRALTALCARAEKDLAEMGKVKDDGQS